jgi:serine/threonine protein phosphatase 1
MAERIIAIGDIHGCSTALESLLNAVGPKDGDLFVPLGDYVDRGPNSKRVIEMLIELSKSHHVEPIFGNHEQMMMSVIEGKSPPHDWLRYGGVDTLDSYGFSGDLNVVPVEHVEFLRSCHDFFVTDKHFFVHANYVHNVPLEELDELTIRWRSLDDMPGPHVNGKIAVVGHTPDKTGEILDVGYLKCIDTYCYGGQWLTALDVLSGDVWQANDEGTIREK